MIRQCVSATAAFILLGCGVPDFFDQHPPNVRDAWAKTRDNTNDDADTRPAQPAAPAVAVASLPPPDTAGQASAQSPPSPGVAAQPGQSALAKQDALTIMQLASVSATGIAPPGVVTVSAPSTPLEPVTAPTISQEPVAATEAAPAENGTNPAPPPPAPAAQAIEPTASSATRQVSAEKTPEDAPSPPPAPSTTVASVAPTSLPAASVTQEAESARIAAPSSPSPAATPAATPAAPVAAAPPAATPSRTEVAAVTAKDAGIHDTRNAHCQSVAQARADDASANGVDRDLQKAVYDGTYANCVAWATTHQGGD